MNDRPQKMKGRQHDKVWLERLHRLWRRRLATIGVEEGPKGKIILKESPRYWRPNE